MNFRVGDKVRFTEEKMKNVPSFWNDMIMEIFHISSVEKNKAYVFVYNKNSKEKDIKRDYTNAGFINLNEVEHI